MTHRRTWCSTRARFLIVTIALTQLLIGTAIVTVRGQRSIDVEQAVRQQRQSDQLLAIEARLEKFDGMKIEARLAVLDDMKLRVGNLELLMYGSIITLILNLIGTLVQIRGQKDKGR